MSRSASYGCCTAMLISLRLQKTIAALLPLVELALRNWFVRKGNGGRYVEQANWSYQNGCCRGTGLEVQKCDIVRSRTAQNDQLEIRDRGNKARPYDDLRTCLSWTLNRTISACLMILGNGLCACAKQRPRYVQELHSAGQCFR